MTIPIAVSAVALGCIVAIYVRRRYLGNTHSAIPLPPGPPGLPWIGNVIGLDPYAPWLTYRAWARTYGRQSILTNELLAHVDVYTGDLLYSRVLGKDVIIINSEKVAKDLLDNRSTSTSGRPYFITNEM